MEQTTDGVVNVQEWIDSRRLGTMQLIVVSICTGAVILEGFDAQVIGFVAPSIIKEWKIAPASMGTVFSAALFGIMIGTLFLAPTADRIGRRTAMLVGVSIFGTATLLTTWVQSLDMFAMLRFLTGLGLGMCMPNAVALTAEYAPQRLRSTLLSWNTGGFSLGAFVGGMLVAHFAPLYGWRVMFTIGGILPLLLVIALFAMMPESARFLTVRGAASARIANLLRRFDPTAAFGPETRFVTTETHSSGLPVKHLFSEGRGPGTIVLWVLFAVTLLNIYLLASWTPTVLHAGGLTITAAVVATALQQAGSVTASIVLGPLFDRFGFFRTLVPLFLITAVAVIIMGNSGSNLLVIYIAAFIAGAGVMGGNSSIVVIAGVFYPTFIRATGVGWGLGLGRVGAILGPLLGGAMLAAHWSPGAIFLSAAVPPVITAGLLLMFRYVTGRRAAFQTATARP